MSSAPRREPGRPIVLAFGGDTHFMGVDATRLAADPATAMGPIAAVLRRADFAMVNLETAVTERGAPQPKQYTFRAPASAFTALRAAGVDVVTMANNHGMDYGLTGLRDSLAAARAARFPVVGIGLDEAAAFRPYRVTVKGDRLAIVAATQVIDDNLVSSWTAGPGKPGLASAKDVDRLVAAVRAARVGADTVVVYLHYGRELATCPTGDQRDIANRLIAAGADIVVGSHAHVLLGGGWHGRAYVDYGLGNFVFYSSGGATAESGVLELTVAGRAVTKATWLPATLEGGVPIRLTGESAAVARRDWVDLRSCTGLAGHPG
jgi:poly-gamma-glutamate synthesis protein (capsule biosynthesis protein)